MLCLPCSRRPEAGSPQHRIAGGRRTEPEHVGRALGCPVERCGVENHITFGGTYVVSPSVEVTFAYMHAMENTVEGEDSNPAAFGGGNAGI
jgi:hypothetical protein